MHKSWKGWGRAEPHCIPPLKVHPHWAALTNMANSGLCLRPVLPDKVKAASSVGGTAPAVPCRPLPSPPHPSQSFLWRDCTGHWPQWDKQVLYLCIAGKQAHGSGWLLLFLQVAFANQGFLLALANRGFLLAHNCISKWVVSISWKQINKSIATIVFYMMGQDLNIWIESIFAIQKTSIQCHMIWNIIVCSPTKD